VIIQAAGTLASENLLQFDEASQRLSELTFTAGFEALFAPVRLG
jgi:hypothetical protein